MAIKYKWLAGTLRDLIKKDVKNQINKLPSEQELCRRYHVSRQTVRQALNLLTQEGLIEKRHGSGSYITGHSANLSDDQIAILISDDSNYIYPGVLDDIQGTLRKYHFSSQVHITRAQDSDKTLICATTGNHCGRIQKLSAESESGSVPCTSKKELPLCLFT